MDDRNSLDRLSEAVADGTAIDWNRVRSLATSDGDQTVIEQLRIIAAISTLHRTSDPGPSAVDVQAGAEIAPPVDARAWGSLFILGELGNGSFGRVFRALDPHLQREVALKVLRSADDPAAHLVAEARLLARIRHPNVVTVYGADVVDREVGLWMELVRGRTLASIVAAHGPFGAGEAAVIGATLCRALAAVHQAGLLHRDIKAQNVMREDGGRIVLMDFGAGRDLADVNAGSRTVGTPVYLAPEVLTGAPATVRSDIYSLGVLLFFLTTGRYPAVAATLSELRGLHARGDVTELRDLRPDLPPEFVEIVTRALDRDPSARYESAGRLEQALLRMIAPVADEAVEGRTATPDAQAHRTRIRSAVVAGALAATIAVALVATWRWTRNAALERTPSIAVMPLRNLSGDSSKEYLADSLTDVLITQLTKIKGLRVLSYSAVLPLKAQSKTPTELSSTLGVRYVLAGAIAIDGTSIRTTVQLVDGRNGETEWAEEYTRGPSGLLGQQSEIAKTVVARLKGDLAPEIAGRLELKRSVSAEGQDLFLRGQTANDGAIADFVGSVRYLERAVIVDPQFADAWAALSLARVRRTNQVRPPDREAQYKRARTEALKALELDPMLAVAYTALGNLRFYHDWDWNGAEAAFRRATELAPGDGSAHYRYSLLLAGESRADEAIEAARRALALDPMGWRPALNLGTILYYARRYDEAARETQRVLQLSPGLNVATYQLCHIASATNHLDEAVSQCEDSVAKGNRINGLLELSRIHALAGRRQQAEAILTALRSSPESASINPDNFAFIYAALGDRDSAFALLEQALAMKAGNLLWIRVDPRFDLLRSDPRFRPLVERVTPWEGRQ